MLSFGRMLGGGAVTVVRFTEMKHVSNLQNGGVVRLSSQWTPLSRGSSRLMDAQSNSRCCLAES
jgi:hypothetical protein